MNLLKLPDGSFVNLDHMTDCYQFDYSGPSLGVRLYWNILGQDEGQLSDVYHDDNATAIMQRLDDLAYVATRRVKDTKEFWTNELKMKGTTANA